MLIINKNMDNMFNPEMMNMVNQVMSNPDSMNQIMQMMQDPSIQQMMNNPEFMKSMGSQFNANSNTNSNTDSNTDRELSVGDDVLTIGLKSDDYNNKEGVIKGEKNNRYLVHISELDKTISIKKDNLQLRGVEEEPEEEPEVIEVEDDSDVTPHAPTSAPTPVHEPVPTPSPDEGVTEESGENTISKTETEDN